MKKLFMILPLVFLLCFTFGCQKAEEVAEEPAVDIAAETEAVRAADMAWANTGEAKDIDGMTSVLTEDAVILVGSDFDDREYWRDFCTELFSKYSWEVSWQPEIVVVADSGDLAYSIGRTQTSQVVEGETETHKGVYVAIWKKQADGSWKVAVLK